MDVRRIEPIRLHSAVQALKIPATLLGVPRECLVVGAHPFLFHPVLAPPLNGIGVTKVGKGGVVKRGVLGQVLPVYLHHQQLSHQVQIVAGRQRACCRQVPVRPEMGMRLGGANVFNEVLAQAVPAMRGVNKKLHILPGHSGDTDYLLAFLGEVMLVLQARIAQAKQELLGQWHSLSDPELEHSLITRIDFNLFCRFDELSIPDYSTLCRYRNWLAQDDTLSELLELINRQLTEKSLKVEKASAAVIDATIIQTAGSKQRQAIEVDEGDEAVFEFGIGEAVPLSEQDGFEHG